MISGTLGLIFLIVWVLLVLVALIDIIRDHQQAANLSNKFLWVLIIIVIPIIGSLIYFLWKSSRKPEA
jgi:hypothetical protein